MARPFTHPNLDRFLLQAIDSGDPADVAGLAVQTFGLTRQAVNRHLRALVSAGVVKASGSTRSRRYELVEIEARRTYSREGLAEHEVWDGFIAPRLSMLPNNVRSICQYGVTEMVNNAIDHSEGTRVKLFVALNAVSVRIIVLDDGIGIFKKVKEAFNLESESDVILELSKGKLTTDPTRHSGEGIFFTSRVFDSFSLHAGNLFFHHFPDNDDWLIDRGETRVGTMVVLEIDPASPRNMGEIFEKFAAADQFRFDVTHVPVKLAQIGGDSLISRSQGKRLVARFEKFSKVVLDFAGVQNIGQAFADEVFRVFPLSHPTVHLTPINTNDAVERMIRRVTDGAVPNVIL